MQTVTGTFARLKTEMSVLAVLLVVEDNEGHRLAFRYPPVGFGGERRESGSRRGSGPGGGYSSSALSIAEQTLDGLCAGTGETLARLLRPKVTAQRRYHPYQLLRQQGHHHHHHRCRHHHHHAIITDQSTHGRASPHSVLLLIRLRAHVPIPSPPHRKRRCATVTSS